MMKERKSELEGDSGRLAAALQEAGIGSDLISKTLDSGYYLRDWTDLRGGTYVTVSDMMYGNKQFSSSFAVDRFASYLKGSNSFGPLPPLRRLKAKNRAEVDEILSEEPRSRYLAEGSLSFRGQPREYRLKRAIPNPVRGDGEGRELSILPGIYRQKGEYYTFADRPLEHRTIERCLLEFDGPSLTFGDFRFSYDAMRTEQHYATQTAGLDVAFDVESALFFATHEFVRDESGLARYERIRAPHHAGVIFCFRFTMPSVSKTEFLIRDFDFFKKHRPERILRQSCGLPLIGPHERNIAMPDLDCIIELEPEFTGDIALTPEFMFPPAAEDPFYAKLLELKASHPELANVVEYEWARRS